MLLENTHKVLKIPGPHPVVFVVRILLHRLDESMKLFPSILEVWLCFGNKKRNYERIFRK
jgi:hypothetical protein